MMPRLLAGLPCVVGLCFLSGCSSEGKPALEDGDSVELSVEPRARTFVDLSGPSLVTVDGLGEESIAWDLAVQGHEIFTNGGSSGPGDSSAFGPLSAPTFLSDSAPEVPLMLKDRAGGALIDWYYYSSASHELFSRYHVYGLKDGERLFKLQILGYYDQLVRSTSAFYRVRYAEVTEDGAGETREVGGIDATSGGSADDDQEPSACLDLDTGQVTALTPKTAADLDSWHLCFRRDAISVNGGRSGPRGMQAVDLQADQTATETGAEIEERTADSELESFEAVDYVALSDTSLGYREDGVVTAFGERWLEPGSRPLAVSHGVWFVIAADGAAKYLVRFSGLSGDPAVELATFTLEAKRLLR